MNYIKELNAFYQHIVFEPLSGSTTALWHTLMHFNNRCGWRAQFSVAASMLEAMFGVKGSSFKRAREELKEKGYIQFTSRGGNQSAVYQMVSRVQDYGTDGTASDGEGAGDQMDAGCTEEREANIAVEEGQMGAHRDKEEHLQHTPTHYGNDKMDEEIHKGKEEQDVQVAGNKNDREKSSVTCDGKDRSKHAESNCRLHEVPGHSGVPGGQPKNHVADNSTIRNVNNKPVHTPVHNANENLVIGADHNKDDKLDGNAVPLTKHKGIQNKTIQNQTTTSDAICFYQQNFGMASSYVQEDMLGWIADIGEELVLHAMKLALEQNKANWRYVKGILQKWSAKGITNLDDVKAEEVAFQNQRQERNRGRASALEGARHKEPVPDWFRERKQKKKLAKKQEKVQEEEVTQEELWELLAELREGQRRRVMGR